MDFRQIRIPYQGREKYPSNGSGEAVARNIINNYLGGLGIQSGGDTISGGDENRGGNAKSFIAWLSKNSGTFSALDLVSSSITDTITVYGFRDMEQAQTLIGNINNSAATGVYDIEGIPESGMSIIVMNSGTTGMSIRITIDSTISEDTGTLTFPVAVNINDNQLDPYHYVWYENQNKVMLVNLTYSWTIDRGGGASVYNLDLSNDRAGVNVNSAGTIYSASTAALTCCATTWYGTERVNATYTATALPRFNAHDFGINTNTGVLYWNSNFGFDGPSLPIDVTSFVDGNPVATKTMNIEKNYPGADGAPAVTRWIVPSVDVVRYNPNLTTNNLNPSAITAYVMKQVGAEEPTRDNDTQIYYWYNEDGLPWPLPSTGCATMAAVSHTFFGLKNSNDVFYEKEDIPTLADGVSGTTGPQGPAGQDGQNGQNGTNGESAWYLSLDNDNASVNCDSGGTIYQNAYKPTCKARLYHGTSRQTGTSVTYIVDRGTSTGVTTAVSNGILTISCTSSTFNFTGDVLSIVVSASTSNTLRDVKTFTITKSYAGATGSAGAQGSDGAPAVTYWIQTSSDEILYDPNTEDMIPTWGISATSWMQRGEEAPVSSAEGTTMKYSFLYRSNGGEEGYHNYTPKARIQITSAGAEDYSGIRFLLGRNINNNFIEVDREDVPLLYNGVGPQGPAGQSIQGRTGPAVRGPYDYALYSAATRCWCAGESSSTCDECAKWIDVIVKDGTYYYCNTTYNGRIYPWSTYASKWTAGDNFDFVATNLLLASAASINFLTNNALYLRDNDGYITAGAQGGSGINFWAGDDSPGMAPFRVNYDGTMTATKGTFGCMTIGKNAIGSSSLNSSSSTLSSGERQFDEIDMNQEYIHMYSYSSASTYGGESTELYIKPTTKGSAAGLSNGYIDLKFEDFNQNNVRQGNQWKEDELAINTNGKIQASRVLTKRGGAVTSYPFDIEYIPTVSANTLFKRTGYWHINGENTKIPFTAPGSLFHKGTTTWYYNNEDTGIKITPSSGPADSFTSGDSYTTWSFNGSDLGVNGAGSTAWNSEYNQWMITISSIKYPTGIGHPDNSIIAPNAIYQYMEPSACKITGCPTSEGAINRGYIDRGSFGEVILTRSVGTGTGYTVVTMNTTAVGLFAYTRCSWITITSQPTNGTNSPNISYKITNSYGGYRYGFIELMSRGVLVGRLSIIENPE